MKVKIIKNTQTMIYKDDTNTLEYVYLFAWYKDKIGLIVSVNYIDNKYFFTSDGKLIHSDDCILIEDHRNKLIDQIYNEG